MAIFTFVALVVTGFAACAEFGSYAFVHPVIRRLPQEHHVAVEQGLLGTFGRVMPGLMTTSVVISIAYTVLSWDAAPATRWLSVVAAASFGAALISTAIVNVPINQATGTWDAQNPPPEWKATRDRWEFFQGVRSWLLLLGFIFLCAAVSSALT
jgi:uncharacterized membrane protein